MKRIRSVKKYLADIDESGTFYIGVQVDSKVKNILTQYFDVLDSKKTLFMPQPYIGIMSKRNTVGEFIADKTKPKETQYRAQNWSLKDWGGTWHSGTSEVPYPGYPKNFMPPKNYCFHYLKDSQHNNNQLLVINKTFTNVDAEFDNIRFCINLVLEIFSRAETFIFDTKGQRITPIIKIVPWEVLPKGEKIWNVFKNGKSYSNVSESEKQLIKERFNYIESFKPDAEYRGIANYNGYVVFCFENKKIYVLDSAIYGNAIYIFSGSWKKLSKLSKREIIRGNLEKKRIIHSPNWKRELKKELTE